jgi:Xaa-Pro aminopeptidase
MLLNRARAEELMEREGLDALVATTGENVYYLSDYGNQHVFHFAPWGIAAAILPRDASIPPTLVVQDWELPYLIERPSWMPEMRVQSCVATHVPDDADLTPREQRIHDAWESTRTGVTNRQRLLGKTLTELGLAGARIGFDDPRVMDELAAHELHAAQTVDTFQLFREIRLVKTPEEVVLLSDACRKNQAALESMAAIVGEGVVTGDILRHYLSTTALQGGYGSHSTGGGADRPWHTYPDLGYRLKPGDIYHLDPAGQYSYYWADLGRSSQIGEPTPKFEHLYGVLQAARAVTDPMLVPGVSSGEVKAAAVSVAGTDMPAGFSPLMHSIGLEQYDHPQSIGEFLSEDFVLEAGMVLNLELLYFEFPWGVLQLEDTFHITPDGPVRLSTLPMEPFFRP